MNIILVVLVYISTDMTPTFCFATFACYNSNFHRSCKKRKYYRLNRHNNRNMEINDNLKISVTFFTECKNTCGDRVQERKQKKT